ncbi:hypothetical protein BKH41_02125 [Helicobacter sp. 12S02232-10]|uniref:outer membrane beta-barrel protein n=1 Tax=Helicobacter sp. 12S02232-10 TaxID=1476197 RepID=UPI000BA6426A|nr:outer membrane beta-barrel protein [Helicobacter sp. 12S02232-10]PAF49484.1 hypothetical protein BKH41_02125 [Helicobacter sp. 12S02232-10]
MKKLQKLFLCTLFLAVILSAQDDTWNNSKSVNISIPKKENEEYGIAQIRERQELIRKKSGKYIGIGIGGFQVKKNYKEENQISLPAILSLKGGVQTFFNKNIAIRGFFGLDLATGFINYNFIKDPSHSFYSMLSLGIDIIGEFPLSKTYKHFLGAFAGIGGGATIYADNQDFSLFKKAIYTAGIMIEGGVTLSMFVKHRIEFGFKILPTAKELLNSRKFETSIMPYVMYNYKF